MGLIILWDRAVSHILSTNNPSCMPKCDRTFWPDSVSSPPQWKQELTLRHSYSWPQVYLSPQTALKRLYSIHFTTFFNPLPKTQVPSLKIIPKQDFIYSQNSKFLEVCKKVYKSKFKYFKFMVKRDYIQKYTIIILTLMFTF